MAKRTPLYDKHVELGGKIVDFAGYDLPVQYSGILAEHNAVRTAVGLFDVSHMGELLVQGAYAEAALNKVLTNDITGMYDGQCRYSILPNENGGAVDDVIIYRERADKFFVVVNGANVEKDAKHIGDLMPDNVIFKNMSEAIAQIAVQGPKAIDMMKTITDEKYIPTRNYSFVPYAKIQGLDCYISRTGYTGEDGVEIYCWADDAMDMYDILLRAGKDFGCLPCGLGARDTLRLEAAMPLYGHELSDDYMVDEVGLNFAIKMNKADFVGKKALGAHTPEYCRIGAKVIDKGIAREHCVVYSEGQEVGIVSSGTHSPTLGYPICMLRIKKEFADKPLQVDVRGKLLNLEVVSLPFYKRQK